MAMRRKSLSERQRKVLSFIAQFQYRHGYAPSIREIGDEVGLGSSSSVAYQLTQLENRGYIRRSQNQARTIELLVEMDVPEEPGALFSPGPAVNVPLVGRIAAGVPITAEQQVEEIFPLPRQVVGDGELFLLLVSGDSMIDAAICDGDWVVVRQLPTANNGDIVAAMLDGEATVKVFRQRDGHTWLLPRNSNYEPILGDEAQVLGKVVAVLRSV
jgi:repressor LexA